MKRLAIILLLIILCSTTVNATEESITDHQSILDHLPSDSQELLNDVDIQKPDLFHR